MKGEYKRNQELISIFEENIFEIYERSMASKGKLIQLRDFSFIMKLINLTPFDKTTSNWLAKDIVCLKLSLVTILFRTGKDDISTLLHIIKNA